MRARVLIALFLFSVLPVFGQGVSVWPAQAFTATSQTGVVMKLNSVQGIGSASSGTITLTGTSLTTVTFSVMVSTDGGLNYFAAPIYTVASPTTAATTSVTATSGGQYQIGLANATNLKIVTSGTFTATTVNFQLATSPNGGLAKSTSGGGNIPDPLPADKGGTGTTTLSGFRFANGGSPDTAANSANAIALIGPGVYLSPADLPLTPAQGGTGSTQAPSGTGQVCISQSTSFCSPQTFSGDGTLAQNGALTISSLGGFKAPLRIGASAPTLYSGTTSVSKTLASSLAAAGEYQACAYIDVTVAGTAGTMQPALTYTSDGNVFSGQNIFPTGAIAVTSQWTAGQACYNFYADISTAISLQLKLTSVTGTPTFRYTFLLYQLF